MVHKRYRDPSMGYDRSNAREDERAVIEEQLQDTADMASVLGIGEPAGSDASDALARRMSEAASELRNNDLEADVALGAVSGLDMDSLVGDAPQGGQGSDAGHSGLDFGAPMVPETAKPSMGQQAEALFDGMASSEQAQDGEEHGGPKVESPKVTRVNRGQRTEARAAKSDGMLSRLMRMLRGS